MNMSTKTTLDTMIFALDEAIKSVSAFEDSKKRSDYILDMVDESIITTDEQGIILSINSFFENRFGYTHKEMVGKSILLFLPKRYQEEYKRLMTYKFEGIFFNNEVYHLITKDKEIECNLSICRMTRNDNQIRYILIFK